MRLDMAWATSRMSALGVDRQGHIVTQGAQVFLGGNDSYIAMCHKCYVKGIQEHKVIRLHGQG